jgi:atypical dual specificity phosphatase
MFVKKYYGICNTPKYTIKTTVKLPGLIMMIGYPCSGKTTFCMELMNYYPDIVHINQDELGRKECESLFSSKAKNNTIILDRCNVSKEERKEWLTSYTQLTNKKFWAIYFNLEVNVCKERVKFRENHPTLSGPGAQKIIEDIYRRVEAPIANENFSEIIMVTDDNSLVRAKNKFGFGFKIDYDLITKFSRTKHRANLGIFYDRDTYKIKAQNISHFVDSSYHAQFKLLNKWILNHTPQLMKIFDKGDYIIYGEWVYLKHSINYVKLPDYFIAYDIYDRIHDIFLKRSELELLLKDSTIAMVPIIYTGKATLDKLKSLVQTQSQYYDGPVEGIYVRAF